MANPNNTVQTQLIATNMFSGLTLPAKLLIIPNSDLYKHHLELIFLKIKTSMIHIMNAQIYFPHHIAVLDYDDNDKNEHISPAGYLGNAMLIINILILNLLTCIKGEIPSSTINNNNDLSFAYKEINKAIDLLKNAIDIYENPIDEINRDILDNLIPDIKNTIEKIIYNLTEAITPEFRKIK